MSENRIGLVFRQLSEYRTSKIRIMPKSELSSSDFSAFGQFGFELNGILNQTSLDRFIFLTIFITLTTKKGLG